MVVFGDLDQVVDGSVQLTAGHGGHHHGVELGCQLPHVLLVGVHQTLKDVTCREELVTYTYGNINERGSLPRVKLVKLCKYGDL